MRAQPYIIRVPGNVGELPGGRGDQVEDEDKENDERTDHSPRGLPEEIRLVSNHEPDIIIKPVRKKNMLMTKFH